MVIVSFKPKMPESNSAFCLASESNKQNTRDRTLDLPSFFLYTHITSLKNRFRLHKARVCPAGLGATFAVVFVLIYMLREFPLSAVTSRFELRYQ